MKNHARNLFVRALPLVTALVLVPLALGGCGAERSLGGEAAAPPPALQDQGALTSRAFRPVKIDLRRAEALGRMSAVRPELTRSLIQRVRTTQTQVCAGERLLADVETVAEPGVEVRVQGQRAVPALVAFHATGDRTLPVEARQYRDGRLVGIDRQEVPITVVACPDRPLVELTAQGGESSESVVVRVRRVQGLAGGERVEEDLREGLRYRYDFGDGAAVESDQPEVTHRYDAAKMGGQRRATFYLQVTAIDRAGKVAVGRRAYDLRPQPELAAAARAAVPASEPAEMVGARMRAHQEAMENNPQLEATIETLRAQARAAQTP